MPPLLTKSKTSTTFNKMQAKPKVLLTDLGNVLVYSTEKHHTGKLNPRHTQLLLEEGDNYNFFKYFGINQKLIDLYAQIRQSIPIYMITEGSIQNYPPLKSKLEKAIDYQNIITTGALYLSKKEPEAYK